MARLQRIDTDRLALSRQVLEAWEDDVLRGAFPYEVRRLLENEIDALLNAKSADPELADALIAKCRDLLKRIESQVN